MSILAQGLTGLVLALALADPLMRQPAGLLILAVLRGMLAGLALAAEGLFLAAALTALGAGVALPMLARRTMTGALPEVPWPTWVGLAALTPLALAVGPLGVPMAVLTAGLLALLARPGAAALALTTMQIGVALALPALAGLDLMGTGLAEASLTAMGVSGPGTLEIGSAGQAAAGMGPTAQGPMRQGGGHFLAAQGLATTLAACLPIAAGLVALAGRRPGWRAS